MILALTNPHDAHTELVLKCLEKSGHEYLRVHTQDFLSKMYVDVVPHSDERAATLVINGRELDLRNVKSVWNRRPRPIELPLGLGPDDANLVRSESNHVLRALWAILIDRFWVNDVERDRNAAAKPLQLLAARQIGFSIPRTIMTRRAARALEFIREINAPVVYKSFTSQGRMDGEIGLGLWTTIVTAEQVEAKGAQISLCPCIFQEYVEKQTEIRVTVVGRTIFAAEMDTQRDDISRVDWRKQNVFRIQHRPIELPKKLETLIYSLMDRFGLVYACLDFIRTPDDRFVFLEINPNGQWLWIQEILGLPIAEAISRLLVTRDVLMEAHGSAVALRNDPAVKVMQ